MKLADRICDRQSAKWLDRQKTICGRVVYTCCTASVYGIISVQLSKTIEIFTRKMKAKCQQTLQSRWHFSVKKATLTSTWIERIAEHHRARASPW